MQVAKVLSSLTFRYIAKYVIVLAFSVFLLLGAIYAYFSYNSFARLSTSIVGELDSLRLIYQQNGLPGVNDYIDEQRHILSLGHFYYLISDIQGKKLGGDLPVTPRYREFDDGWLGFELALFEWGESIDVDFLARQEHLGDDYSALVARDYANIVANSRVMLRTLFMAFLATVVLGLFSGFFSASRALGRVDRINRELSRIIRDVPGGRLAADKEKGHARDLALIMNDMLAQTEVLMQGVQQVTDNIAHDLRTPLTRLRNQLSQLRETLSSHEADTVEQIIADCDGLLASFNAVLRISTLESCSKFSGGNEVNLQDLLRDVVELYEPVAQEKDIALDLLAEQVLFCRGEADLLFQMLANLLDNAIKYTPPGGRVSVALHPRPGADGAFQISVADTGPGISEDERDNVFRRFYREESSRSTQPGHGLGLSLARAIAQYHHGELRLRNNNPGLRVEIDLP